MTEDQKKWLDVNPRYSVVKELGLIALTKWTDQGYLWGNGRFSLDDGRTLFLFPIQNGAVRVGREYAVV